MTTDETASERCTNREDYVSTGSLAGSIASASSGFGSLPKKRPALFSSGNERILYRRLFMFSRQIQDTRRTTFRGQTVENRNSVTEHDRNEDGNVCGFHG